MSRKSIDPRLARAIALQSVDPETRASLADSLGLAHERELAGKLADPSFVRARVAALPPLCWVVLEVLVEAAGATWAHGCSMQVQLRTGAPLDAIRSAIAQVLDSGLVLAEVDYRGSLSTLGLLAPAGSTIYDLLAGISLPSEPPQQVDTDSASLRRRTRDSIALCGLAAHRKLRFGQNGLPHRTTLKGLTKNLGIDLEQAEELLLQGHRLGLLIHRGERVVPSADALIELEQGGRCGDGFAAYVAMVHPQDWTSVEALWRRDLQTLTGAYAPAISQLELRELLGAHPSLIVAEHAGHAWVRRRTPVPLSGDGHVTPSFEVMLGPAATAGAVARVALCSELVRVDHVLTFKLTPESVSAALACGLSAEQLRVGLRAVSPHGLPENVQFMVEDWIAATRTVRVRRGMFVFAGDEPTAARLAAALGSDCAGRPEPSVVEVNAQATEATLERALSKAKLHVATQARRGSSPMASNAVSAPQPDPELRARFTAARGSGDYGVNAEQALQMASEEVGSVLKQRLRDQNAPQQASELLELVCRFHRQALPALEAWTEGLGPPRGQSANLALYMPLITLPWLMLRDEVRARCLRSATDLATLLEQAERQYTQPQNLRPDAERALELMAQPKVRRAFEAAMENALGGGLDADGLDDEPDWHDVVDDFDDPDIEWLAPRDQRAARRAAQSASASVDDPTQALLRRARQIRDAVLARQPGSGRLKATGPTDVRAVLTAAAQSSSVVHVQLAAGRVLSILAETLRQRGRQWVLHCVDLARLETRVLQLNDVLAAQLDELGQPLTPS